MKGIQYLKRIEIDSVRWNKLVSGVSYGLIYANTDYLDHLAGDWEALVWEDYQAVMPLTCKSKFGIHYLYQPCFSQQLGIIGDITAIEKLDLLLKAKEIFSFAEINLNYTNEFPNTKSRNNFIIDLNENYEKISGTYSSDLKKNLTRAKQFSLEYRESHNSLQPVTLYRKQYGNRFPHVKDKHYNALLGYCNKFPDQILIREVWQHEQLLATVLCLRDKKRIYFLLSTILAEGRKMEANHFLIDRLILEYSGQPLILDFEGSDIPGIAAFYLNFGAVNQPYPHIKWNTLPWPWKIFKK
jgi:hypothetical protein